MKKLIDLLIDLFYDCSHDSGSFELAVYSIQIYTLLQLGDDAGRLSIATVSCSADIGDVDIQFHGGARWDQH